jgi:hypothetical protein
LKNLKKVHISQISQTLIDYPPIFNEKVQDVHFSMVPIHSNLKIRKLFVKNTVKKLRKLTLDYCSLFRVDQNHEPFTNLESLTVEKCEDPEIQLYLQRFLTKAPNLKSLTLLNIEVMTTGNFFKLSSKFKKNLTLYFLTYVLNWKHCVLGIKN